MIRVARAVLFVARDITCSVGKITEAVLSLRVPLDQNKKISEEVRR
jgi:hypothetical protein